MKLHINYTHPKTQPPETISVQQFVNDSLDRAGSYSDGQIERLASYQRELADAFARTLDLLTTRGVLSGADLLTILPRYGVQSITTSSE